MNSKCYRKFHSSLTWYNASNDCLSHGGSLAVFTDIGSSSNNSQLTNWLNRDKTYWIGLIRSWWKTTNEGGFAGYFSVIYLKQSNNILLCTRLLAYQISWLGQDATQYVVCRQSVRDVQVPWSHRLEYFENNFTPNSLRYSFTLTPTSTIWSNGNTPKIRVE